MMRIVRTESRGARANAYLIDDGAGVGVLVDGNGNATALLEYIHRVDLDVRLVLVTHHHANHVDLDAYARVGAPVLAHHDTAAALPGVVDQPLTDGEVVRAGRLRIACLHVPGHAPGHLAFVVNGAECFTADVLLRGTVGATRVSGSTGLADLRTSLRRLLGLPAGTRVYPGHGPPTTIGDEVRDNGFVRALFGTTRRLNQPCIVGGEPATLLYLGPDHDGSNKAWVRLCDGTEHVLAGSQVEFGAEHHGSRDVPSAFLTASTSRPHAC